MDRGGFPSPSTMAMTGGALVIVGFIAIARGAIGAVAAVALGVGLLAWAWQRFRAARDDS